jgi:hypothetical protein
MSETDQTTDLGDAGDEEIGALHCLGMCMDWEGHPSYQSDDDAGLRQFLIDCAEGLRWQRDEIARLRAEVASLRLTLGGRTFGPDVPEPIGCPAPGACAQVAEIGRLRTVIRVNALRWNPDLTHEQIDEVIRGA